VHPAGRPFNPITSVVVYPLAPVRATFSPVCYFFSASTAPPAFPVSRRKYGITASAVGHIPARWGYWRPPTGQTRERERLGRTEQSSRCPPTGPPMGWLCRAEEGPSARRRPPHSNCEHAYLRRPHENRLVPLHIAICARDRFSVRSRPRPRSAWRPFRELGLRSSSGRGWLGSTASSTRSKPRVVDHLQVPSPGANTARSPTPTFSALARRLEESPSASRACWRCAIEPTSWGGESSPPRRKNLPLRSEDSTGLLSRQLLLLRDSVSASCCSMVSASRAGCSRCRLLASEDCRCWRPTRHAPL